MPCVCGRGQRGNSAAYLALALLSSDWQFLLLPQPRQVFTARGSEALLCLLWNPGLCGLSHSPVVPPSLSVLECGTSQSISRHLARMSCSPSCPTPPVLPVWMSVSSLTPWLSDFHTVRQFDFSGSSGWFFVFQCVVVLLFVVRGCEAYLPTPPSWPKLFFILPLHF